MYATPTDIASLYVKYHYELAYRGRDKMAAIVQTIKKNTIHHSQLIYQLSFYNVS